MTTPHHFLARAKRAMTAAGLESQWTPGSTTWILYTAVSTRTIQRAIKAGWLRIPSRGSFPVLTRAGYQAF